MYLRSVSMLRRTLVSGVARAVSKCLASPYAGVFFRSLSGGRRISSGTPSTEQLAKGTTTTPVVDGQRCGTSLRAGNRQPCCCDHLKLSTQGALSKTRKLPALISRQRVGWADLRDRLLEFIRKSDHNHRWEDLTDAERAAIVSSVRTVTGTRTRPADDASAETRKLRRGGTNANRDNDRL